MPVASLRSLRFPVEQVRGRRYPEPAHPYRDEFQRDRDRVVHSRAFRRLEDKTQVFPPRISDHFRNRLTHTLEVSQIARTVAERLELEEHLTETLALVHDIGHPPFAHAGEHELDGCMRRFGGRFDHNLHALRIVETFEQRYARFPGLNLTFEVREGIVKHSRDTVAGESPELDEYLPGLRPPLESQLIDLADEIAYNTADLDDAFVAGMFELDDVASEVPRFGELASSIETQFPGADVEVRFQEVLRLLIDSLVSGLIGGTLANVIESGVETVEDVRRYPSRLVAFTPEAAQTNRALKTFLHRRVYHSPELVAERDRSAAVVRQLFDHLVANPSRLPDAHRERIGADAVERVVCDYIAGMTEGFLVRVLKECR